MPKRHLICATDILVICFTLLVSNSLLAQRSKTGRLDKSYHITSKAIEINVDIDAAEVRLRRSDDSKIIRLSIYYTEREFRVYEDYDESDAILDIEFEKYDWVDKDEDNLEAEFTLELPSDIYVDLYAKIKAGEIDIDLGGLSLTELNLTTWAGEVLVEFSEPNKVEMNFLRINTKVGETEISRLGNARFKEAEINGGIGEMTVDFRGQFASMADAEVDLDIGETNLYLPADDIGVKLSVSKFLFLSDIDIPRKFRKSGRYYYSNNYNKARRSLNLRVSPGLGELRIN